MYRVVLPTSDAQNLVQELMWNNIPFSVQYHPFTNDGAMITSNSEKFKEIIESGRFKGSIECHKDKNPRVRYEIFRDLILLTFIVVTTAMVVSAIGSAIGRTPHDDSYQIIEQIEQLESQLKDLKLEWQHQEHQKLNNLNLK